MKVLNKENSPYWLGAIIVLIIIFFILLYFSEAQIPTVFTSSGIVAIISALIGVILTVFVTSILLTQQYEAQKKLVNTQTENERKKEIDTKKFEEKLKTYENFLNTLCKIIKQENNVCEQDIKELIFQIALVRMHTQGKFVNDLFDAIARIVMNINKTKKIKSYNKKESMKELTEHILSVIEILQQELYDENERGNLDKEKYKDSLEILINSIEDVTITNTEKDSDITPIENVADIDQITNRLEVAIKEKLQLILKNEKLQYTLEGKDTPRFFVKNTEWGQDKNGNDFYVALSYDQNFKLIMSLHGANEDWNEYREMYLTMRKEWGGGFNRWCWYMTLKEPYNDWIYNEKGLEVFSNPNINEEFVSYICDLFTRSIEYFDTFRRIIRFRDKLNSISENINKEERKIFIWKNNYLAHEYKLKTNDTIVIDTALIDNQWKIILFTRDENLERIKELLPKVLEKYPEKTQGEGKYILKSYGLTENLSLIAGFLKELREMVEKELKSNNKL